MEHLQNYLIVLVLILFILQRLLKERAIKDTMKSEIIIVLVGLYLIISNWQEIIKTNHTLILIVLSVLLGFIFGVLRAQTVHKQYQSVVFFLIRRYLVTIFLNHSFMNGIRPLFNKESM